MTRLIVEFIGFHSAFSTQLSRRGLSSNELLLHQRLLKALDEIVMKTTASKLTSRRLGLLGASIRLIFVCAFQDNFLEVFDVTRTALELVAQDHDNDI